MYAVKFVILAAALALFVISAQAQSQAAAYGGYVTGKVYADRDHTTREALDTGTF